MYIYRFDPRGVDLVYLAYIFFFFTKNVVLRIDILKKNFLFCFISRVLTFPIEDNTLVLFTYHSMWLRMKIISLNVSEKIDFSNKIWK